VADDPMHQFQIGTLAPIDIGGVDASFTIASAAMLAASGLSVLFMTQAMKPAAMAPGRTQMAAEMLYGFVHGMVKDAAGEEGVKKFFPFVFSLFIFIFMANMIGMFPYFFTATSQVVVTAMLAMMVFLTVIVVGVFKNGFKFLKLFFPSGVPWPLYFIVTPIEIISFFSRPLSHAIRLWANILAGHILLKVFAGFVPAMAKAGAIGVVGAILPLAMTVGLYGLEFLVAFLQAYVFAMLTAIYLNDALHPGH
jgi:F-type H+-transporting ATPase subunit a